MCAILLSFVGPVFFASLEGSLPEERLFACGRMAYINTECGINGITGSCTCGVYDIAGICPHLIAGTRIASISISSDVIKEELPRSITVDIVRCMRKLEKPEPLGDWVTDQDDVEKVKAAESRLGKSGIDPANRDAMNDCNTLRSIIRTLDPSNAVEIDNELKILIEKRGQWHLSLLAQRWNKASKSDGSGIGSPIKKLRERSLRVEKGNNKPRMMGMVMI